MTASTELEAGPPGSGPASVPLVKGQLKITDARDDELLDAVVTAVNELVRDLPIAATGWTTDPVTGDAVWTGRLIQGAVMLAGRIFRRRNSPAGVEAFGDAGPVYVQRNDPDIAQLLQLGAYAGPAIG